MWFEGRRFAGRGDFLRWVAEKRVTTLDLPTAYWHELVRELSESALSLPKSLRMVIVGGEKASAAALATWRKFAGPRVRWVNTYGPTETSVIVTSYEPEASEELPAVLPIGRPIANTRIYILGKNLQPLPVGIAGDLYVSGPGLARGYLNRPETTAEKFVRDPFRKEPGARMYKTGDLARYLASAEIEFAGRTDDQVKTAAIELSWKRSKRCWDRMPECVKSSLCGARMRPARRPWRLMSCRRASSSRRPVGCARI